MTINNTFAFARLRWDITVAVTLTSGIGLRVQQTHASWHSTLLKRTSASSVQPAPRNQISMVFWQQNMAVCLWYGTLHVAMPLHALTKIQEWPRSWRPGRSGTLEAIDPKGRCVLEFDRPCV